jgi:hypothetical protein
MFKLIFKLSYFLLEGPASSSSRRCFLLVTSLKELVVCDTSEELVSPFDE